MNDLSLASTDAGTPAPDQARGGPVQHRQARPAQVAIDDELVIPKHKRLVTRYTTNESGATELHLDYGQKEIAFDEPELFGFAEGLAQNAQFVAGTATTWGEGYDWPRIQEMLEQLIEKGILQHARQEQADPAPADRICPSPLPPAVATRPRTWSECEAITAELTGRPLEVGYLELVVPIYRIAHPVLDLEERQVGEGNVFPKPLRLDIPTEWRVCQHAGSRYQDDMPMNVTALKTMRKHWSQCMAALLPFREAYLRRFPEAREGWTVGGLQRLSTLVLALPAYLLMRPENPVANGGLHPVLSNLFRITDGVRMSLHYMMFLPAHEPTLPPDAPMTADEIYAYSERNNLFLSDHGVCAGPRAMIEELLQVLVDGKVVAGAEPVSFDEEVQAALSAIEPAFDYELLALQVHAIVNALWPEMIRSYERLGEILESWPGSGTATFQRFRNNIREKVVFFRTRSVFATEAQRTSRERVLADMVAQCGKGLGALSGPTLAERIAPAPADKTRDAEDRLRQVLKARLCATADDEAGLADLAAALMDYFRREQGIVRAACEIQPRINELLGRTPPARPFTAADINLYFRMQDGPRRLPYLVAEELEGVLDLGIAVTRDRIEIFDGRPG